LLRFTRIFGLVFIEMLFWFTVGFGLAGLLYSYLGGYRWPWREYWFSVICASALGGLAVALMAALADAFFCQKLRIEYGVKNPGLRVEEAVELSGGTEDARDLVKKALAEIRAKIISEDFDEGTITAKTGFSFKTTGERVFIRIEDAGPDAVRIAIKSEPRFNATMFGLDMGQNAKNVARLVKGLKSKV
jgi:hypothetical protein